MITSQSVRVPIQCMDGVTEKMEAVYDRITQRAYEQWLSRRAREETIVDFWSAAERELICKPQTEVREWGHGVVVEMMDVDVDPSKIRLFMSATELLAMAPLNLHGLDRWMFRYLRFERLLDSFDASAEFENGTLRIAATVLNAPDDAKIHVRVA